MDGPCFSGSPWPPARGHAEPTAQGPADCVHPGFEPGPYYLGVSGRTIHHDNLPHPGGVVAVVPVLADAHLLKAAPDLFAIAESLATLPALVAVSDTGALAARIAVLAEAAQVAVARALGAMS